MKGAQFKNLPIQAIPPCMPEAACLGKSEVMDGNTKADVLRALQYCASCPVLLPCQTWIRNLRRNAGSQSAGLPMGVVGGRVYGDARRWLGYRRYSALEFE